MGRSYLLNTPSDRSGLVVIFVAVGVCWTLTVLVTRLSGSASRRRGLGWEDWGIVASTCFACASSIAVFAAVAAGLGKSHSLHHSALAKALYAADVLYIPALAFSKLATLQLITALSPARRHKRVCYALCAVTTLWAVAGVFAVAIRCDLSEPWDALTSQQCPDLFLRWCTLESIGLMVECIIFGIGAAMIRVLQMPRDKKVKAMLAFSVRLPVVVPVVLRLVFLRTALHSSDYSLNAAKAVIAMQCVMHYTTMSASFSYLMPFLAAFDSNLGASTKLDTMVATRSSERRDNTAGSSGHWRAVEQKAPGIRQDGGSMQQRPREDSVDSKAPIIVKTTSYRVEVGE